MKPRVSPDFNGDRATIDVRQELLANLTSVHLKAVECVVLEKYVLLKESMPQELRGAFPEEPPKSFWEQHYYAVLFEKFGLFGDHDLIGSVKRCQASGLSVAGSPGDAQDGTGSGMGDLFSDEERALSVGGLSRASQGLDVGTVGMDAMLGGRCTLVMRCRLSGWTLCSGGRCTLVMRCRRSTSTGLVR